jgi:hypothetical protein
MPLRSRQGDWCGGCGRGDAVGQVNSPAILVAIGVRSINWVVCLIAYSSTILGRPRGRSVDSRPTLKYFQQAHAADPEDLHTLYKLAEVSLAADQSERGLELLEEVVERNPGFVSAIYRLAMQYRNTPANDKVLPLLERFRKLQAAELSGGTFAVQTAYGAAGKHYLILGADNLPLERGPAKEIRPPVFSPEVRQWGKNSRLGIGPVVRSTCPASLSPTSMETAPWTCA